MSDLVDKIIEAGSLIEIKRMSQRGEFAELISDKTDTKFISPHINFLRNLIESNVADEVINYFIDMGINTYDQRVYYSDGGYWVDRYDNVIGSAMEEERDDLVEKIADSQINKYFSRYFDEYNDYEYYWDKDTKEKVNRDFLSAQSIAYKNCSAEMVQDITKQAVETGDFKRLEALVKLENPNLSKDIFDSFISEVSEKVESFEKLKELSKMAFKFYIYDSPFSDKFLAKFDKEAQKEIESTGNYSKIARFDESVFSLKSLEKLLQKSENLAEKIAEKKGIQRDKVVENGSLDYGDLRRLILWEMGKRFETPKQAQEYLNKIPDETGRESIVEGMHLNHNQEVVLQAHGIWTTEFYTPRLSEEGAEVLYKKGLIDIQQLGQTILDNLNVKRFKELAEQGLDTKLLTLYEYEKQKDFYPIFIEHGMNEDTEKVLYIHAPKTVFNFYKDKDPQKCAKNFVKYYVGIYDGRKMGEYLEKLITQYNVELDADDIRILAERRVANCLKHTKYGNAYKEARDKINKEQEIASEKMRVEKLISEVPFMSKEKQQKTLEKDENNKEVVKALFASGMNIPTEKLKAMFTADELTDIRMSEKNKENAAQNEENRLNNEKTAQELATVKEELTKKEKDIVQREEKIESAKTKLSDEQMQFQRYVDDKSAELKAKSEQLGFQKRYSGCLFRLAKRG